MKKLIFAFLLILLLVGSSVPPVRAYSTAYSQGQDCILIRGTSISDELLDEFLGVHMENFPGIFVPNDRFEIHPCYWEFNRTADA